MSEFLPAVYGYLALAVFLGGLFALIYLIASEWMGPKA